MRLCVCGPLLGVVLCCLVVECTTCARLSAQRRAFRFFLRSLYVNILAYDLRCARFCPKPWHARLELHGYAATCKLPLPWSTPTSLHGFTKPSQPSLLTLTPIGCPNSPYSRPLFTIHSSHRNTAFRCKAHSTSTHEHKARLHTHSALTSSPLEGAISDSSERAPMITRESL